MDNVQRERVLHELGCAAFNARSLGEFRNDEWLKQLAIKIEALAKEAEEDQRNGCSN